MKYLIEPTELNQTLDQMITPMMLTNEADEPVYINRAFQSQVGYFIDEMPDKLTWFEKAYPDPVYREQVIESWDNALISALNSNDPTIHVVSKIHCADNVYRWFDVYKHIIGNKHAITFLNVDELKTQTNELTDTIKQKDSLLAVIAHDVRSPLGCIKQIIDGYENLNLSDLDIEDLFFKMNNQVDYIFNIVNSLLMRISDDRGRFTEQPESIDLNKFFSKYAVYYKDRLSDLNIGLVLDLPEHAVLTYDPGILDVVCRNLLDNAIRYTAENGVIGISLKKSTDYTRLLIRDTGPGMSCEQVQRIINNTSSLKTHKEMKDGFGLGIILAKEILEKYRGKLSVKSEIGIGTSFIIDITCPSLN
ncbi:HAMP domain-containing histidine kinase [Mucilaginibacter corticis]|uniref:histidine kinase n=1 Tax=Mucilaginibacter corticis TaxID=2597670 RepID=A0A556MHR3_9SPHI|nr:HAMP domain-containing sensor histidine kinase [Mucilaginibacter corticis]TSJ39365.1 HAMP domain-containing histidine kinase [Mucilaginibacter corticis]